MLIFLLTSVLANAQPADFTANGVSIITAKRDAQTFEASAEALRAELGACAKHTGGLNYGELTLSFMIDKRGQTANVSVGSPYVMPRDLQKCLALPVEQARFGRGDVAVGKLVLTLPQAHPVQPETQTDEAVVESDEDVSGRS
ncbi:MAG: hypothetical protein KC912_16685 [Proteobacteria bacterium]|nr:hypothetical protein [Pseudomonadota bacterium]